MAALALAGCGGGDGGKSGGETADGMVNVTVAYAAPSAVFNPLILGIQEGVFKKHGLNVTAKFVEATGATSALLSGDVDFLMAGGGSALTAAAQGAQLSYVATTDPVYAFEMVGKPDITSPKQLGGKKIGTTATGSALDIAARKVLAQSDLQANDVNLVALGSPDKTAQALLSGAVDATLANPPLLPTLEKQGMRIIFDLTGRPFSNAGVTTTKKFAEQKPDVVQGLVSGMRESILLEKSDEAAAIAAMKTYLPVKDDALLKQTWDFFTTKVRTGDVVPRPDQFQDTIDVLSANNKALAKFDLSDLIDSKFAEQAMKDVPDAN
jgi:NitT/TauT family transport system substrate-binding protein